MEGFEIFTSTIEWANPEFNPELNALKLLSVVLFVASLLGYMLMVGLLMVPLTLLILAVFGVVVYTVPYIRRQRTLRNVVVLVIVSVSIGMYLYLAIYGGTVIVESVERYLL